MYRGSGRGKNTGGGMGFGFRGSSPPYPYIGRGRGGLPRCGYYTGNRAATVPTQAAPQMDRNTELSYLRDQEKAAMDNLEQIRTRLSELEKE